MTRIATLEFWGYRADDLIRHRDRAQHGAGPQFLSSRVCCCLIGISLFLEKNFLIRVWKFPVRYVGNSAVIRALIRDENRRERPDSGKFPVNFPVSRRFGCGDWFAADCIVRVAGFELRVPTSLTAKSFDYTCVSPRRTDRARAIVVLLCHAWIRVVQQGAREVGSFPAVGRRG